MNTAMNLVETPRTATVPVVIVPVPVQIAADGLSIDLEVIKALESALAAGWALLQVTPETGPAAHDRPSYDEEPTPSLRSVPTRPERQDRVRRVHAALTEREREVLCLVAGGATNCAIASQLFISPKTASVHVSRILTKLGASNRTEAAALAHAAGLVRAEDLASRNAVNA